MLDDPLDPFLLPSHGPCFLFAVLLPLPFISSNLIFFPLTHLTLVFSVLWLVTVDLQSVFARPLAVGILLYSLSRRETELLVLSLSYCKSPKPNNLPHSTFA